MLPRLLHRRAAKRLVCDAVIAGDRGPFGPGQVRVPAVNDQHRAQLIAAVEGLVLDGVIEGEGLASRPFAGFPAHPEPAARRNIQPQVDDRAAVGDAGVRRDVAVRLQQ